MLSSNTSGVSEDANYIESVFSTYLYTGNGSTQTITNNIDLSTKGGLVWTKNRTTGGTDNLLWDTARGASYALLSNDTNASSLRFGAGNGVSSFGTTGFTVNGNYVDFNAASNNYASWTFRKQPKFFDVVTYTGDGTGSKTVSHSLGSTPGMMAVKNITAAGTNWWVYHRSLGNTDGIQLNSTNGASSFYSLWANTSPTSTQFTVGSSSNVSGETYVAYLFAHDAGGFGLTGTDNVISCGSYTGNGSTTGPTITLGYEPQWLLVKKSSAAENWVLIDNMRGINTVVPPSLFPNLSDAETSSANTDYVTQLLATGFQIRNVNNEMNTNGGTYIYIAIRRGPMKVPTDATKVFKPVTRTGNGSTASVTGVGFAPDTVLVKDRNGATDHVFIDKLRGIGSMLRTPQTFSEYNNANSLTSFDQNGVSYSYLNYVNGNTVPYNDLFFKRAPSFFDEVCYTGTGANTTVNHNLGIAPELMIVKQRSSTTNWLVYSSPTGASNGLFLNLSDGATGSATFWNATTPTSSVFSLGNSSQTNASGGTFVAYLFATCAGVSKVGSYTGTGTTKQVDCGFAAGARFVLIKRTDSTGDWYVWDTARGIVAGNDPYLLLNSTAAETTSTDYIDTYSAGFELSSTAPAAINASGGSYIFLAIA